MTNQMNSQSNKSINSGVSCQVTNCSHYTSNGKCCAENISVQTAQPSYGGTAKSADCKADTCCGTFSPCNDSGDKATAQ
jgi:hypothetical protein